MEILDADSGLFSARFSRGSESSSAHDPSIRKSWLFREEKPGQVIIQSYCPDHPQIEEIINGTYQTFAQRYVEERRASKTPLILAKVYAESPKETVSRDFIRSLINRIY